MIALFAEAPALPLHTAGPYVAAAYIVFILILVIYLMPTGAAGLCWYEGEL